MAATTNSPHPVKENNNSTNEDQYLVQTPYGRGRILSRTSASSTPADSPNTMQTVELVEWKQSTATESSSKENNIIVTAVDGVDTIRIAHPHGSRTASVAAVAAWQQYQQYQQNGRYAQHIPRKNSNEKKQKSPSLYTTQTLPGATLRLGDWVECLYGTGTVQEIRNPNNNSTATHANTNTNNNPVIVVRLSSWRLDGRSTVKVALPASQVRARLPPMDHPTTAERVEQAEALKALAGGWFSGSTAAAAGGSKDYRRAGQLYVAAVEAVRWVQHEGAQADGTSTNAIRADLLQVMITACNNAATCRIRLEEYRQAGDLAQQALLLLDALDKKYGLRIHQVLQRDHQLSDAKLFGTWRCKSLLVMATASWHLNQPEEALAHAQRAKALIDQYTTTTTATATANTTADNKNNKNSNNHPERAILLKMGKEIARLRAQAQQRIKAQRKKEKMRAQAMFGAAGSSSKSSPAAAGANASSSPPTTTTTSKTTSPMSPMGVLKASASSLPNPQSGESTSSSPSPPSSPPSSKSRGVVVTKKVSFSDRVESDGKGYEDTMEWYQDPEVVIGLSLFAGTVAAATAGLAYWFGSSGRR